MQDSSVQRVVLFDESDPFTFQSGATLAPIEVAYETWGTLNSAADNAVFIPHALTGDSHACGDDSRPGWWDTMIGPGKPVDTDQFFVICPNLLGGCQGTTGPSSINPATGAKYGLDFPLIQIRDYVTLHRALLKHLGISRLYALVGGSLGGMQGLQWALDAPEEIYKSIWIAATSGLTAQNIAFSAVARSAIMRDPEFQDGLYPPGGGPRTGLAVARMMAHITYLSDEIMTSRFGRDFQFGESRQDFGVDFAVESYLDHQGRTFLDRFDALSYLYLSRSLDYFDPFAEPGALDRLAQAADHEILVLSFDSDWRFGTEHSTKIVDTLAVAGISTDFEELRAPYGHDSFLLNVEPYLERVRHFLNAH